MTTRFSTSSRKLLHHLHKFSRILYTPINLILMRALIPIHSYRNFRQSPLHLYLKNRILQPIYLKIIYRMLPIPCLKPIKPINNIHQ